MTTEHEAKAGNVFELFFLITNQNTRSKFVCGLAKMTEAEGSFDERVLETVWQFPVIYNNGSFLR